MINKFVDDNFFLSNFYLCNINHDTIVYPSAEHMFQAQKTLDRELRRQMSKINTCAQVKRYGRTIRLRKDWDKPYKDTQRPFKVVAMKRTLSAKFSIPELRDKLLATGDEMLVEGNLWHDNYWGACTCSKCAGTNSLNMLGILLMELRSEIREFDTMEK